MNPNLAQALLQMAQQIVADDQDRQTKKTAADILQATLTKVQADAAAAVSKAQADVGNANTAESAAESKLASDLAAFRAYIDANVPAPVVPPAPAIVSA